MVARGVDAESALERLQQFQRYAELADAVISVEVEQSDETTMVSTWTVRFRRGIMRWTERDQLLVEEKKIVFEQISGDFTHFAGAWHVEATANGARIGFEADFDLGIPSLSELLSPLAKAALHDNVVSIMAGLFEHVDADGPRESDATTKR